MAHSFALPPFTPLPRSSLRRLRTALSPPRSPRARSPSCASPRCSSMASTSTVSTTAPLTRSASPVSHDESPDQSPITPASLLAETCPVPLACRANRATTTTSCSSVSPSLHALLLRRKPSALDVEMEDERRRFGAELAFLEPRPPVGCGWGSIEVGIFEVLEGRV